MCLGRALAVQTPEGLVCPECGWVVEDGPALDAAGGAGGPEAGEPRQGGAEPDGAGADTGAPSPPPSAARAIDRIAQRAAIEGAAVREARAIVSSRALASGRKAEVLAAGALYVACNALRRPRPLADLVREEPRLVGRRGEILRCIREIGRRRRVEHVARPADYVDALAGRLGAPAEARRAALAYALRHGGSGRSPLVVAATGLAAAGLGPAAVASAAGLSESALAKCLGALPV